MSKGNAAFSPADGLMKERGDLDTRRSAARRTAWLLAALVVGFYLSFYFLGQVR